MENNCGISMENSSDTAMTEDDTYDHLKYRIITNESGSIYYYNSNGLLHREDGPAVILSDGTKKWYCNGVMHREDGPAVTYVNGYEAWWKHGKFIRGYL